MVGLCLVFAMMVISEDTEWNSPEELAKNAEGVTAHEANKSNRERRFFHYFGNFASLLKLPYLNGDFS